jgi:hypothetical protein
LHLSFVVLYIIEDAKIAHSEFPDGRFVFERRCQINQSLPSSGRHSWLISQLFADLRDYPALIERPDQRQLLNGKFVDEYLIRHAVMISCECTVYPSMNLGKG